MDDEFLSLKDFIAWVRLRRIHRPDAPVDEEMIKYVTKGVERFIEGKTPWARPRKNKPSSDLIWKCFYKTNYVENGDIHMPQDKEEGGAYFVVGKELNLSPDTVERYVRTAKKLFETPEGQSSFLKWLGKEKGTNVVEYTPAEHPKSIEEQERSGFKIGARKRRL